ncbi:MAG: Acyl-CoA dehydrogenase [Hydrocarboniphaga sp.]|uniref:acyl-CoA dehydrogenase family protein n=1 Tax=Hydrocarboniphaga sp. TaxID=2033016 RepID=UPI002625B66A|nr:acyl-CoA dehydrogenase family protein [Hydrocarboniphaga sp.]MDB5969883.1 Acyl-CoA dehydrogenase [Hydrocarboniphaga sp.]
MTDEELRLEASEWLARNWDARARKSKYDPDGGLKGWLKQTFDARWSVLRWPEEWYGRGLPDEQAKIVEQEFARVGATGTGLDRSHLAANTLLTFGQDALKRELLPKFLTGQYTNCLLYSEPGAGSDLAALRARADRDGDRWLINGQKVWTSGAATADYGLLIARTDWDAPKHKGISFFFIPMKQKGIEVRPLHQITGDSHFSEVFLDNAVVPAGNLLGKENDGWKVLQTALAYERLVMGEGAGERRQGSSIDNKISLIAMAREAGCIDDPCIRQDIARALAYRQLNALNLQRAKAEMAQGTSSPIMSLGKLAMSRILHEDARVMTTILGASSVLDGAEHPRAADVNYRAFNAYMTSIGGGTDQIQRNIIGERVLGLPREVELNRDLPFRESLAVPKS